MQRLRLEFVLAGDHSGRRQCFDVPDVTTALVVADINQAQGVAELHRGAQRVARLERRGSNGRTYWHVDGEAA
ncbi:MAG: hypothetical protein KDE55_23375 [Novosphingobium sp.]|nr:hypothetical protein [Erythrobacter sp.]MCB2080624.1 hypothetical protein [Novosphingobium sp.]